MWVLALGVVASCATVPSPEGESSGCEVAAKPVAFEEACQDGSSLLALCDGQHCGMYRCREVVGHLAESRVVPARGAPLPRPSAQAGAQRYWGSAQGLPHDSRPVFLIPWDHKLPLLPSQLNDLEEAARERLKPHEHHHVFSRAFRLWFARKKINIDQYTIPLELMKHRSIHRGANGGPWNEAWRRWILANDGATQEEIFRYAGQLIYEFELFGPVVPYRRRLPQPLPEGYKDP